MPDAPPPTRSRASKTARVPRLMSMHVFPPRRSQTMSGVSDQPVCKGLLPDDGSEALGTPVDRDRRRSRNHRFR
ncbi:hypothetical protein EV668_3076 [Enterovirga rhinocerotis]|uniref:Uncharacterized protein n=1 Tax=Enterovirga rhinocerotis TaxID=1339210 RepID=A0A4R7BWI8_9HYPH|nr:hypothetical protein EV668_3076 [Enterovirga rhinocerotis]